MKKTLIATLLFLVCFAFTGNVHAASRNMGFYHIPNNSWEINTVERTKTTYYIPKVEALAVATSWTNPCSSCKLGVRMYQGSDWFALGSTLQLGEEKTFIGHDGSQNPGTYNLGATRVDFTLLETTATIKWTYD